MAQKVVVVFTILGSVCIMASQVIKPNVMIPYLAVGLWAVAIILFVAALLVAIRAHVSGATPL